MHQSIQVPATNDTRNAAEAAWLVFRTRIDVGSVVGASKLGRANIGCFCQPTIDAAVKKQDTQDPSQPLDLPRQ